MKVRIVTVCSLVLFVSSIYAETINVVTPYLGTVENDMSRTVEGNPNKLELKDNSLLKGLFFQRINPDE